MEAVEINFDGIVGPTHNYGGLSYGNIASIQSTGTESNPKAAALQGLEKMRFLMNLGIKQGVLPPHERPHLPTLRALGYSGTDAAILSAVAQKEPEILASCSSAAAMWTANAATVCASADSIDKHVHFTAANLSSKFHRSIEAPFTSVVLKTIFKDPLYFRHHDPMPQGSFFGDEGAANHTRFCHDYGGLGIQLFVFGRYSFRESSHVPKIYPARQAYEATQAIIRQHKAYPERIVIAQQNPRAIDAGVFHNDVISVGNRHVFLYHEAAFVGKERVISEIEIKAREYSDLEMLFIEVPESQLSLTEAVSSYFFNSQLISRPDDASMLLLCPSECQEIPSVQNVIDQIVGDKSNPINQVHYFNLHQSMRNGGGPACLRFRVPLNENELAAVHPDVILTHDLYDKLTDWVEKHYRDRLAPKDLADPKFLLEVRAALDELTKILNLGSIYPFQQL